MSLEVVYVQYLVKLCSALFVMSLFFSFVLLCVFSIRFEEYDWWMYDPPAYFGTLFVVETCTNMFIGPYLGKFYSSILVTNLVGL
jgi:hypothetical protein